MTGARLRNRLFEVAILCHCVCPVCRYTRTVHVYVCIVHRPTVYENAQLFSLEY